jgi:hypothetical protein
MGGIAVLAIGPWMMLTDRVTVDDEHFTSSHGFPWDKTKHDVRFDDLKEIGFEMTERRSRRGGKSKSYAMLCQFKSGSMEKVPIGTCMEEASGQILGIARKKGVPLIGAEQLPENLRPR